MAKKLRKEGQQETETIRLNKYLSDAGICSRRQADLYIEEGKVNQGLFGKLFKKELERRAPHEK